MASLQGPRRRNNTKSKSKSKAKPRAPSSLKSTRPPLLLGSTRAQPTKTTKTPVPTAAAAAAAAPLSLSSKHTRALINAHHLLQKQLARARARDDVDQVREIEAQIAAQGGLRSYQLASRTGQSAERGGDSSRVLVRWLERELDSRKDALRRSRRESRVKEGRVSRTQKPRRREHQDDDDDDDEDGDEGEDESEGKEDGDEDEAEGEADDSDGYGNGGHALGNHDPLATVSPIRILEIGALSTQNALNVKGVTRVRRIDLRSSAEGIEEMDFMQLPLPGEGVARNNGGKDAGRDGEQPPQGGEGEGYYDVLSLSLVLNYVPDARQRGAMLKRTTLFFAPPSSSSSSSPSPSHSHSHSKSQSSPSSHSEPHSNSHSQPPAPTPPPTQLLPCLFLVLPSPCLHNSRYLTPPHLAAILNSLGYRHLHTKTTRKLHYSLWRFDGPRARDEWIHGGGDTVFKKREINPGGGRNNFCIVLE
ncbi:hypothetical protein AYO21_07157 [Fonsecaea monophora]|uniref:25S rRNA adenine-N(1) methyltransferase n=1 Tax=Fonsecaea monophora TaxID=254056 RepID=A0A177F4V1_9EURO|nr:hypothetical protein AYO21_07157 [Fonsecaea monophora]KAH0846406.1 hypothetical protein FOPE_11788 [Fonsecaea pedrosoi]OAG38651.1 hypothetical protein AYO21_07157 [Fonsecaea monophora]